MIKHNLTLILRNLWSRRVYTFVILLSLTVGFVCANILISFLVHENNTDTFNAKRDRIFQIFSNDPFGGSGRIAFIPDYFHGYLVSNYGEVENVCQVSDLPGIALEAQNNSVRELTVLAVDSSFFTLFDFPLVQGRRNTCLGPDKIVLTKDKALLLFNKPDVVGMEVTVITPDTTQELVVSAVVEQPEENSHLIFDALIHHSVFPKKWHGGVSYILLAKGSTPQALQEKINKDVQRPGLIPGKMDYFLSPLVESYFNTDNKMAYMKTRNPTFLRVGYIVCGLVLFIAGFNFINLFLLFCQNRKREIGIKKTLGVTRRGLFDFSILEASVYIFISYLLALLVTFFSIPFFNAAFETNLSPEYLLNIKVVTLLGVILFLSGILVVILSVSKQWSMRPISLMNRDSTKVTFNKFLFTVQFVIAITLAVCSVTIIQQMRYVETAPLGFNRNIIQLNAPNKKLADMLFSLKQKIAQLPDVNNVTVSSGNPVTGNMIVRYDLDNDQFYTAYLFGGDDDFLKTLDLKLVEGTLPSETSKGKLVNQKLVHQFNLTNPVGERIPGTKDTIIGVVKDFTCGSFKQEPPPAIISYYKNGRSLLIDYRGNNLARLLPHIQTEWSRVFPEFYCDYKMVQADLMTKYKEETFFYKIVITFAIISMILSCFGLFALSWAVIQSRTKEMGIRKVLGATAIDILNLLTLTFTKRILIAFVIAAPTGYFLMNEWLTRFANKIELNIWIFGISGFLVTVVAFATLSFQTVKATTTNPVDEIRKE